MKGKDWVYKLSYRTMKGVASMALMVTVFAANRSCMWFLGQDEMPKNYKKLRKF